MSLDKTVKEMNSLFRLTTPKIDHQILTLREIHEMDI